MITASGGAAWLEAQHASLQQLLLPLQAVRPRAATPFAHGGSSRAADTTTTSSVSSSSRLHPQQQQQQQHQRARRVVACAAVDQQQPGYLEQRRRGPVRQQQQQQRLHKATSADNNQQHQHQQQQQAQAPAPPRASPPQQQADAAQQQQQQQPLWGYLSGEAANQWTWDDDYNEDVIAKAAAAARALPPTPRQQTAAAAAAAAAQQRPTVVTRLPEQFSRQVLANGVLLVDKPQRWSSADVVRQLKAALKVDRIGVGVPLDTEATGLLIVLLGAAGRLTPKLEPLERTYSGTLRLGATTNTYDASGVVVDASDAWQRVSDADLAAAARRFTGELQQVPCMWSSSKYRSKPLRWYAERGEVVALEPRSVQVSSLQLWREPAAAAEEEAGAASFDVGSDDEPQQQQQAGRDVVHFRAVASKGASMRVLSHDLGAALGCGAHLASLRRQAIGGFSVDTAWSLDVLLPLARKYAKGANGRPAAPRQRTAGSRW